MRLLSVVIFLVIALFDCCLGMNSKLPKLSVLVPADQVPIEIIVNGGYVALHHTGPDLISKWRFVGDIGLSPLVCEGSLDMACALTCSRVMLPSALRVTRKDIMFTRGEALVLNKTRKLTFTWAEEFGESNLIMQLHYNELSQTNFYFMMHPQLISVTYHNEEGHNIGRVIVDINFPESCINEIERDKRDSGKDIRDIKEKDKGIIMMMSERELLGCNRFRVPYGIKRLSLRIHEDMRYTEDSPERYKYDLLLYT